MSCLSFCLLIKLFMEASITGAFPVGCLRVKRVLTDFQRLCSELRCTSNKESRGRVGWGLEETDPDLGHQCQLVLPGSRKEKHNSNIDRTWEELPLSIQTLYLKGHLHSGRGDRRGLDLCSATCVCARFLLPLAGWLMS